MMVLMLLMLTALSKEVIGSTLAWVPVGEAAVGKEMGLATNHAQAEVVGLAASLLAAFHELRERGIGGHSRHGT